MTTFQGARLLDALTIEGLDTHNKLTKKQGKSTENLITIPFKDGNLEKEVQSRSSWIR